MLEALVAHCFGVESAAGSCVIPNKSKCHVALIGYESDIVNISNHYTESNLTSMADCCTHMKKTLRGAPASCSPG